MMMTSEWNRIGRKFSVLPLTFAAHSRAALCVALLSAGPVTSSQAQSLLTDSAAPYRLIFQNGIPLPPKRPAGFEPVHPAPPPTQTPAAEAPADTVLPDPEASLPANPAPVSTRTSSQAIPLPPVRPKFFSSDPAEVPITITNTEKTPPAHTGPGKGEVLPDLPRDEIVKQASAVLSEMTQFQTEFTQVDGTGRKVTGHLAVMRPGRLRFDYNAPSSVVIIADGNNVGVIDRKLKTRDVYSLFLTPLKFLLKSKIDLKSDIAILDVRTDPEAYVITAEDKSTLAGTSKIALSFDRHSLKIKQWTVTDPQGYDTTVVLGPLDTTTEPDGDLFVIPEKIG